MTANPRDINVLPDYRNDPRVVGNLVDGVNKTRDDIHMWLAPFTEGANHFITLSFTKPCQVALLRIWVSRINISHCLIFCSVTLIVLFASIFIVYLDMKGNRHELANVLCFYFSRTVFVLSVRVCVCVMMAGNITRLPLNL